MATIVEMRRNGDKYEKAVQQFEKLIVEIKRYLEENPIPSLQIKTIEKGWADFEYLGNNCRIKLVPLFGKNGMSGCIDRGIFDECKKLPPYQTTVYFDELGNCYFSDTKSNGLNHNEKEDLERIIDKVLNLQAP